MTSEAYATAATTMRYHAFLPPQYGAGATAAGTMLYTPASPYSAMMPATAVQMPSAATTATQQQHMLAGAYAPSAYDYSLAVPSSATGAATAIPPQYFYQQMMDPSQYMTMAGLQGTHLTAAHGAGGAIMPAGMYQSIGPATAVSAAVTSATAALPAPSAAASYPAIQDQR